MKKFLFTKKRGFLFEKGFFRKSFFEQCFFFNEEEAEAFFLKKGSFFQEGSDSMDFGLVPFHFLEEFVE